MTSGAGRAARPVRERDRYRHASRRELLAGELRALARSPGAMAVLAILVGGWLAMQLMTPRAVRLEDLSVGACLHVPTSANDAIVGARPIGTPAEVADVLAGSGANVAPCDGSHSHEVAGVFTDGAPSGTAYPGLGALEQQHASACAAAFASYVGHPVAGSAFELTVVVQAEAGWDAGRRAGVCLVSNADGTFLTSRAGGSGR